MNENAFKSTLVLYTLHDAYKDSEVAKMRIGAGEFGIPLSALEDLVERMNLRQFVNVTAEDIRAASVSLLSPKVADLSTCTPGTTHLLTFVHLADAFASQQTARDCTTAENRLREISRDDAVTARMVKRTSKRTGITPDETILPELQFYYHELDDYRGLSTLLIHKATEEALAPHELFPLLYFANGILYVGPKGKTFDVVALRQTIATNLFSNIRDQAGEEGYTVTEEACLYGKRLNFRKDVYLFSPLEQLLKVIEDRPLAKKSAGFLTKVVARRVEKKKYGSVEDFFQRFALPPDADKEEAFAQRWNAAYTMFMGIEDIAKALFYPADPLEWLLATFHTPSHVANAIRQHSSLLHTGGVADHCLIIAYHWLINTRFISGSRNAVEVETIDVTQTLKEQALRVLAPFDLEERRMAFVNEELGLQGDIASYLHTYLTFSFNSDRCLDDNRLKTYELTRTRSSHNATCVICNRDIPSEMKSKDIITDIAGQQALVFSNKLQPSLSVKGQMHWCPMCYLEFMLRKLSGQSYPRDTDYNGSYRIHLYVLPDYSFTPQLWEYASRELLRNFEPKETAVSRLVLRGSKDDPSLPTRWLEQRCVDEEWLEQVQAMFAHQATFLKTPTKEGKVRGKLGDRISFSFKNPNYVLITYDTVVTKQTDERLKPTFIETWTKALYAAVLIHLLTGARVSITDKPYLSITRPEQMKTIIEMEGLHPLLTGLMPMRRIEDEFADSDMRASESGARLPMATLPVMLDLLAAVWEINAGLHQSKGNERRNLDKQVAYILEEVKTNYLAGATLYKQRERDKASAYPAFTRACQILLPQQGDHADEIRRALSAEGYELMIDKEGGDLMNLAERITETCLQLYHPPMG